MRIAALVTTLALAAATAAPANACKVPGPPTSYYLNATPADLEPNELLLEVLFLRTEPGYKTPPFYSFGDVVIIGQPVTLRFAVVRVLHGKFTGNEILVPAATGCGGIVTMPPGSANTGLIAGFVTPPSPDWNDSPALVARVDFGDGYYGRRELAKTMPSLPDTSLDPAALLKRAQDVLDPYERKDLFERAVAILRTRADSGDTSAMTDLGLAEDLRDHNYGAQNAWIERAATLGNARAMFFLAQSYDRGPSTNQRAAAATDWYLKAAEAGHACAMGTLAQRYRFGWGGVLDKEQALYWYRKATAAGAIMSPYEYEIEGRPPRDTSGLPPLKCPSE